MSCRRHGVPPPWRMRTRLSRAQSRRELRELCKALCGQAAGSGNGGPPQGSHLATLLAASELSVATTALLLHAQHVRGAGWSW